MTDERQRLLREALDALPWLDVTLEDGTGGQMVDRHAMLDIVDSALAAQAPAQDCPAHADCPFCAESRRLVGALPTQEEWLRNIIAKLGDERQRAHTTGEHEYERGLDFIHNDLVRALTPDRRNPTK